MEKTNAYEIAIHQPILPLYWVVPGGQDGCGEYIWSPDYSFLFPEYNRTRILKRLQSERARQFLLERHDYFIETDVYTAVMMGEAEIIAVKVAPWLKRITRDLKDSVSQFSELYARERLTDAYQAGLLSK